MLASPTERTSTRLGRWSGTSELSSIESVSRAWPWGSRVMSSIEPTGTPPTFTWSPTISWLAFSRVAWTRYEGPDPKRSTATTRIARAMRDAVSRRRVICRPLPTGKPLLPWTAHSPREAIRAPRPVRRMPCAREPHASSRPRRTGASRRYLLNGLSEGVDSRAPLGRGRQALDAAVRVARRREVAHDPRQDRQQPADHDARGLQQALPPRGPRDFQLATHALRQHSDGHKVQRGDQRAGHERQLRAQGRVHDVAQRVRHRDAVTGQHVAHVVVEVGEGVGLPVARDAELLAEQLLLLVVGVLLSDRQLPDVAGVDQHGGVDERRVYPHEQLGVARVIRGSSRIPPAGLARFAVDPAVDLPDAVGGLLRRLGAAEDD